MTDYVLHGLVKRRSELACEEEGLRARLATITSDLAHLDATILLFDPEFDLGTIRPKRPRPADAANPGERSRLVLDVLRRAGEPVTVGEMVRRVMAENGQDAEDKNLRHYVTRKTEAVLARQERRGVVRAERVPGEFVRWRVER